MSEAEDAELERELDAVAQREGVVAQLLARPSIASLLAQLEAGGLDLVAHVRDAIHAALSAFGAGALALVENPAFLSAVEAIVVKLLTGFVAAQAGKLGI